jgi:hypothetical protein
MNATSDLAASHGKTSDIAAPETRVEVLFQAIDDLADAWVTVRAEFFPLGSEERIVAERPPETRRIKARLVHLRGRPALFKVIWHREDGLPELPVDPLCRISTRRLHSA